MRELLIFGMGYTATRLAKHLRAEGWTVHGTTRDGREDSLKWGDPAIPRLIEDSSHILSSIPADGKGPPYDPVLRDHYGQLREFKGHWIGYLSSTGVYGDTRGGWVDETSDVTDSHRTGRGLAERAWRELASLTHAPVHIFRLPGIYGPGGRSALDRVREGRAHRIDLEKSAIADHVFSRIHVDDIVKTVHASMKTPGKVLDIFNVCDDEPASGTLVTEFACDLLGLPYPPLQSLAEAKLSPMGRSFYDSWRRVRNDKIKRVLGIRLTYPSYREGLQACLLEP
jgi:nucleoside-diphosphate-sugar epimerase